MKKVLFLVALTALAACAAGCSQGDNGLEVKENSKAVTQQAGTYIVTEKSIQNGMPGVALLTMEQIVLMGRIETAENGDPEAEEYLESLPKFYALEGDLMELKRDETEAVYKKKDGSDVYYIPVILTKASEELLNSEEVFYVDEWKVNFGYLKVVE